MKNVKNKNKLKYKIIIVIAVLIFAAGVAGSMIILNAPKKNTVIIKSDGKILYTLDLSSEPDRTFEIKTDRGENTVEIKDGKIRVISADCPDKNKGREDPRNIRRLSRQNLRAHGPARKLGNADSMPAA